MCDSNSASLTGTGCWGWEEAKRGIEVLLNIDKKILGSVC